MRAPSTITPITRCLRLPEPQPIPAHAAFVGLVLPSNGQTKHYRRTANVITQIGKQRIFGLSRTDITRFLFFWSLDMCIPILLPLSFYTYIFFNFSFWTRNIYIRSLVCTFHLKCVHTYIYISTQAFPSRFKGINLSSNLVGVYLNFKALQRKRYSACKCSGEFGEERIQSRYHWTYIGNVTNSYTQVDDSWFWMKKGEIQNTSIAKIMKALRPGTMIMCVEIMKTCFRSNEYA